MERYLQKMQIAFNRPQSQCASRGLEDLHGSAPTALHRPLQQSSLTSWRLLITCTLDHQLKDKEQSWAESWQERFHVFGRKTGHTGTVALASARPEFFSQFWLNWQRTASSLRINTVV